MFESYLRHPVFEQACRRMYVTRDTWHVNTRWRAQERYQMGSLTRRVCGRTMLAMGARGGMFTGL